MLSSRHGHIESFHDKLRDECLNRELFGNLREVRVLLESWRVEYNERRPHSALGYRTPNEYAGTQMNRFVGGCAPPNPAPLAAAGVRGELRSNATRWQTNEKQNTKELTFSPKTGPGRFEFSGGRSSLKREENRDEKETQ